jgi:beta-barrel assembly-enhancing protease
MPSARSTAPQLLPPYAHALLASLPPPAPFTVTRAPGTAPLTITPVPGCASELRVEAADDLHGKADGVLVLVSAGMMRFAAGDDELAALIAHELAHNILRHRVRLDAAGIKRGMARYFGRNARLIKITEEEADRLSAWLLTGAGFGIDGAERFWTAYGKRVGSGLLQAPTHPGWKRRVAMIKAEAQTAAKVWATDRNAVPPMLANPVPFN